MGFRNNSYAKVWDITPETETRTKLRISISRKNRQTGEYEDDFSGFVKCVGAKSAGDAAKLNPGDRIKIGDCDVNSKYIPEKKVTYYNFIIYSFEPMEDGLSAKKEEVEDPGDDIVKKRELPF